MSTAGCYYKCMVRVTCANVIIVKVRSQNTNKCQTVLRVVTFVIIIGIIVLTLSIELIKNLFFHISFLMQSKSSVYNTIDDKLSAGIKSEAFPQKYDDISNAKLSW